MSWFTVLLVAVGMWVTIMIGMLCVVIWLMDDDHEEGDPYA